MSHRHAPFEGEKKREPYIYYECPQCGLLDTCEWCSRDHCRTVVR